MRGVVYAFISVALMATWYPAIKWGLKIVSAMQAAAIETLATLLCSIVLMLIQKNKIFHNGIKPLLLVGLLNAFATIFLYMSLDRLDPIMSSLLGRNYTVFCLILSYVFLKENLTKLQWFLIFFSFVGGFFFVFKGIVFSSWLGIVLVTAYTIFYAVANLITKKYCAHINSTTTIFYIKAVSLFPIVLLGAISEKNTFFSVTIQDTTYISIVSLISMFVGLGFFYKALSVADFSYVNTIRSMGPLFVFIYSFSLFPAHLTLLNAIGGIVLVLCVSMLSIVNSKKSSRSNKKQNNPSTTSERVKT